MLLFLFATNHRYIFCSSWSRGISEKLRKEICIACSKSVFWKIFSRIVGTWYWKSAILSTAPRICQHEDIGPIRAWYQNLVSWNGCIKGMSPGSATLSPFPGNHSAHFAHCYFSYLTPFVAFSPTAKPCPRLISHKIALVSSVMEHSAHELFCCLAHDCNYCDEKLRDINFKSGLYRPCHGFQRHVDE